MFRCLSTTYDNVSHGEEYDIFEGEEKYFILCITPLMEVIRAKTHTTPPEVCKREDTRRAVYLYQFWRLSFLVVPLSFAYSISVQPSAPFFVLYWPRYTSLDRAV